MSRMVFQPVGNYRFGLNLARIGEDEGWFRTEFDDDSRLSPEVPSD